MDNLFSRTNYILWYRNTFTAAANTMVVLAVMLISAHIFLGSGLLEAHAHEFLVLQMSKPWVPPDSYLGLILVYSAGASI